VKKKSLDQEEDSFQYAMHYLYKNFSDPANKERFPDVVAVPDSIKPEAVLLPSVEGFTPPDSIIHFKTGTFSQRLIFFMDIDNP
jgi:hypothetical protein